MYNKDLTKDLRLRLSERDFDFLTACADERGLSVSETIRSIIGEYRRSLDFQNALVSALKSTEKGNDVHGNTESNINN